MPTLKVTARAQNAREAKASYPPKGAPSDEEEAIHAQWSENQAAQRDEDSQEYGGVGQRSYFGAR